MTKIVSLIPARKGSKGIPNKNLVNLCGKPLISYAIQASKQSSVKETWVSSDSDEILKVSQNLGAKTIERPSEISGDNATSESALIHFAENIDFDILVFIQCTAPLIKFQDINQGIKTIKEFDSVVSVSETHQMFWDASGPLYDINNRARRQDSTKKYIETGSFFITSKENLLKYKNRLSGNIGFVEIPKYRSFDIDSYDDIKIVETIINSKEHENE
ncbi:acylneuraminate cytidylyltransferase family protein [Candidatus Pelagibacter bacterium]|nr:acylneuraminate cytidylyltransferase family protein [Candidatus Pelagibacter bacterium]MDA8831908.1 acylneuraminate cytidylyltransferase family protein [Candidatus Pelagibacter bacterium]